MDSKKNNYTGLNSQNILGEEEKENKQDRKDESEINSKYSRPLKINIDIALENFVKDNLIEIERSLKDEPLTDEEKTNQEFLNTLREFRRNL